MSHSTIGLKEKVMQCERCDTSGGMEIALIGGRSTYLCHACDREWQAYVIVHPRWLAFEAAVARANWFRSRVGTEAGASLEEYEALQRDFTTTRSRLFCLADDWVTANAQPPE